jgi:hypothetical protein
MLRRKHTNTQGPRLFPPLCDFSPWEPAVTLDSRAVACKLPYTASGGADLLP